VFGSDEKVELICKALAADPKLAGGINVLGTSQGGILLRGYLERCNNPPVKNFISWVAPMMGVYGVPLVLPNSPLFALFFALRSFAL
jgi:palmitoyl-protein thioesterase